jgi:hypothetical protein
MALPLEDVVHVHFLRGMNLQTREDQRPLLEEHSFDRSWEEYHDLSVKRESFDDKKC